MIRKDTSTSPNQSRQPESNRRHTGYKSVVLPTELCRHVRFILYVKERDLVKSIEYHFSFRRAVTADATCYPGATRTRAGSGIRTPARFPVFRFSRPTPSTTWVILPILYFTICQPCVKLTGKYNHPKTDPKDFVKLSSFSFVPSSLFKLNFEF